MRHLEYSVLIVFVIFVSDLTPVIVTSADCSLPSERGRCTDYKVKWYYNSERERCEQFWYGGCEGNDNRFDNKDMCLRKCKNIQPTEAPRCTASRYGCCADGQTFARGPRKEGCRETLVGGCRGTQYGCCEDGSTYAQGPNKEGCQERETPLVGGCAGTRYGCCADGSSYASGPNKDGCPETLSQSETCRLEKDMGGCRNFTVRWFYDAEARGCARFWYGGCDGNGNNFENEPECKAACSTTVPTQPPREEFKAGTCPPVAQDRNVPCADECQSDYDCRGLQKCCSNGCARTCQVAQEDQPQPEYKPGTCPVIPVGKVGTCETECKTDYQCQGQSKCCYNGCGYTCQLPAGVTTNKCSLPSERGSCSDYVVKWYYNSTYSTCKRFWYGGCHGNENNFNEKDDCERNCVRSVSASEACSLPVEVGPCRASLPRFYFNTENKRCEAFRYGGCRGNANRYRTRADCQRACEGDPTPVVRLCGDTRFGCCPDGVTIAQGENNFGCPSSCQDKEFGCCEDGETAATGPNGEGCEDVDGSGDVDNFCQQSVYGCCLDNITPAEGPNQQGCDVQKSTPEPTPEPEDGNICHMPKARGPCTDYVVKWYYNATQSRCARFWYGGCQNNGNNFVNETDCLKACGKKPDEKDPKSCEERLDPGTCPDGGEEGRDIVQRYYFNRETRQCEPFRFSKCSGGNNNNFADRAACEQLCPVNIDIDDKDNTVPDDFCQLPQDRGPCAYDTPRWSFDYRNGRCVEFMYGGCGGNRNNFASLQSCQRYCAPNTERQTEAPTIPVDKEKKDTCRMDYNVGPCRKAERKYYYDFNEGVCKTFLYGGCLGNDNNFDTKERCESTCSREHVCNREYVTPALQCNAYIRRYRYDRERGDCIEFTYGGCGGNSNNFNSLRNCQTKCAPELLHGRNNTQGNIKLTQQQICALPRASGMCLAYFERYYFNSESKECEKFVYGGCGGNQNNYYSLEECQQACGESGNVIIEEPGSGEPDGGDPDEDISEYCHLPMEIGPCRASIPAWYYDHLTGSCKQFNYGGCRGNNNRFSSKEMCEASCSRDMVCKLKSDSGNCIDYVRRFYYSVEYSKCVPFNYGGCGGNANNFQSENACSLKCGRAPVAEHKPGECPPVPLNQMGSCVEGCSSDYHCPGDEKCCSNGCGRTCQSPRGSNVVDEGTTPNCMLPVSKGTCSGMEIMYYYDDSIRDCRPFRYSTCGGNSNRFASGHECRRVCVYPRRDRVTVSPRPTQAPITPAPTPAPTRATRPTTPRDVIIEYDTCDEEKDTGPCSNYSIKWYYHSANRTCYRFWYGGCDGNANRFDDEAECRKICIDRRRPVTDAPVSGCRGSRFGCCPDGVMAAADRYFSNCKVPVDDNDIGLVEGDYTSVVERPGRNILLSCEGFRSGTVAWYKDSFLITDDRHYSVFQNGTLLIRSLSNQDSGMYACRVSNGNNLPYIQRYRLQIEVPIGIFPTPAKLVVKPGRNAFLHCQAYGNPQPIVSWTHGNQPVRSGGKFQVFENGTLIISMVETEDMGEYICVASNGVTSPAQRIMMLSLRESLRVSIDTVRSKIREGEKLYLHCRGYGYPTPSLQWEKMERPLITDGNVKASDGFLRMSSVTLDDTGVYTCVASNEEEKVEASVSIQVIARDDELPDCRDTGSLMQCKLIVTARLCGYTMYSKRCCLSCEEARKRLLG